MTTNSGARWSRDDLAYLRKNRDTLDPIQMAEELGRSVKAIRSALGERGWGLRPRVAKIVQPEVPDPVVLSTTVPRPTFEKAWQRDEYERGFPITDMEREDRAVMVDRLMFEVVQEDDAKAPRDEMQWPERAAKLTGIRKSTIVYLAKQGIIASKRGRVSMSSLNVWKELKK